jgi:hypothetical protein
MGLVRLSLLVTLFGSANICPFTSFGTVRGIAMDIGAVVPTCRIDEGPTPGITVFGAEFNMVVSCEGIVITLLDMLLGNLADVSMSRGCEAETVTGPDWVLMSDVSGDGAGVTAMEPVIGAIRNGGGPRIPPPKPTVGAALRGGGPVPRTVLDKGVICRGGGVFMAIACRGGVTLEIG